MKVVNTIFELNTVATATEDFYQTWVTRHSKAHHEQIVSVKKPTETVPVNTQHSTVMVTKIFLYDDVS